MVVTLVLVFGFYAVYYNIEYAGPLHYASRSNDIETVKEELQEDIDSITEDYNRGNQAAWFCAKVTATYRGVSVDEYLGCCSYKSFDDFLKPGGYYEDMIKEVTSELVDQVNSIVRSGEI